MLQGLPLQAAASGTGTHAQRVPVSCGACESVAEAWALCIRAEAATAPWSVSRTGTQRVGTREGSARERSNSGPARRGVLGQHPRQHPHTSLGL